MIDKEKIKKIALVMAVHGYRNSPIEDLHSGVFPTSKTGDFSDVKVVTPYGEIAWNDLSRISDEEMKHLNKTIYNQIYTLMTLMETTGINPYFVMFTENNGWDEPELVKEFMDLK